MLTMQARPRPRELQRLDDCLNCTRSHTFYVLKSMLWLRGAKARVVRRTARPEASAIVYRGRVGAILQAMPRGAG